MKVVELPVGKNDAIRCLRHALLQAEAGRISNVIMVCTGPEDDNPGQDTWAWWSDMKREEILWYTRWLQTYIDFRYFGRSCDDDE